MEEPPPKQAVLPITIATATPTIHPKSRKLKLLPLIFLIYFEVAGGPFGEEPAVKAGGPLLAILGFLVFPFIWSVPEALITAELSTTYPGNGGFVIWADKAFGPFWGSLMGTWKFLSVVINIAAFPSLCLSYMQMVFPVLASGWPRQVALCGSTVILSLVNFTGLAIVGNIAIVLAIVSLTPFVIMSCMAIPNIKPHRWLSLGQTGVEKDWKLFFNTLFWNLNFWDSVSTLAGEVEKPHKTFPKALFVAVIFTCFTYLFPLFAVTGSLELDQKSWETGFYANAAGIIGGKWLKYFLEIGAVIGAIGLYEAQLSSSSFQILGMAEIGVLPKFCGVRHKKFDTPWVGILISTMIVLGVSFMDFTSIISSANFLYSLSMLLEFASFIWLRKKQPALKRPYRVPIKVPGLVIMCLIPSAFLIYVMALGTPIVYIVSAVMTVGGIGWYFLMKVCKSKKWIKFNANEIQDIEE